MLNALFCGLLCWTVVAVSVTQDIQGNGVLSKETLSIPDFQNIGVLVEDRLQTFTVPANLSLHHVSKIFQQIFQDNVGNSSACLTKLSTFTKLTAESIAFFDAAGRPAPGFTKGNVLMLGNYDSCKEMQTASKGYYKPCLMSIAAYLSVYPVAVTMTWTGCLPLECREGDLSSLAYTISGYVNKTGFISMDPSKTTLTCEVENEYDVGAYVALAVLSLFGCLVVAGTLWYLAEPVVQSILDPAPEQRAVLVDCEENVYEKGEEGDQVGTSEAIVPDKPTRQHSIQAAKSDVPESIIGKLLKCFSLQLSFGALLSTNTKAGQVLCLNGIRVLSINWVLLGHSLLYVISLAGDVEYITKLMKRKNFTLIINGFASVDSFFTLSGFLVSLLLLRQLTKRGFPSIGQWLAYYVHRYLRLTIPYMVVLLMQGFLYRLYAHGPFVTQLTQMEHKACKDYWWTNMLYINNFVPLNLSSNNEQCIGQTWYLANDFQFFVIAPVFVVLLFFKPLAGILSTISAIVCSVITTASITYHYKLGPQSIADPNPDDFWLLYNKPYIRITPYLVGILGGWAYWSYGEHAAQLVRSMKEWKKVVVGVPIWAATAAVEYAVVFGLYDDIQKNIGGHGKDISQVDSVFYQSLARVAWGLALTIQILACQCGLGGFINSILSWKGWLVFARLTYAVYLLHLGLMAVLFMQMRHTFFLNPDFEFAVYYLGILGMSYLCAICLYTCVEQPLASVEAMTYRKQK